MPENVENTSLHVRRAVNGDVQSLNWIVTRFVPFLLIQAKYRLGTRLASLYDPEDIVDDVWVASLPKLANLEAPHGRYAGTLLKYLGTGIRNRVKDLLEKHLRGKPRTAEIPGGEASSQDPILGLEGDSLGVVTNLIRKETHAKVQTAIDQLEPRDREIIILRGIEQLPNQEVAVILKMAPNTVAVAYRRAKERLKQLLTDSVWHEVDDD
jgi:RNA polymerase sigma factor (sigma-70 family)